MGDSSRTFGKLKIALLILLAINFSALSAQAKYGGGTGEPNDPYLIFDANHLNTMSADSNDWDKCFKLMADIDLDGDASGQFSIIGTSYANPFAGVFDGNNHTVSNLRTGMFKIVTVGLVENLGLIEPNIVGNASLVLQVNEGTIDNCYIQGGSVDGDFDVGGLVSMNFGTITSCYSSVSVWGLELIGGLVGVNNGTITNCYSSGAVSGAIGVGGLTGINNGTITACYSISNVSGSGGIIGGLVAMNWSGIITDCYSIGSLSGDVMIGGLVGENGHSRHGYVGTITNCYSVATFTGSTNVGGLVGLNDVGTITGSFWDTDISDVNNMCVSEGDGGSGCDNDKGKTTVEMQTKSTFTDAGWDFLGETVNGPNDIWRICEGEDYPRLAWEEYEKYGGGTGEPNDPYLIYTACQMNEIGADANDWDKHFLLCADIDLSYYDGREGRPQFNMIADYPDHFVGVFDGNDHVIRNFTVSLTGLQRSVALFRNAKSGAVIKNLNMENTYVNVPGGNRIASIHGEGRADIINCKVSGTIIGDYLVGGLSGQNYGNTENCYSYCTIVGEGGGGLIGWNSGIVNQCCSKSIVSGLGDVGGLVGRNFGLITNSHSDSSVTSDSFGAGGLAGDNGDTILSCYALGKVSGDSWVGGLIGEGGFGLTENCYALVDVKGNTGVGGLIGLYLRATISNCYSSGSVSGTTDVGGLLGIEHEKPVIVTSCYFLDPNDGGGPVNGYGEPLTDAEMKQQASFIGWDFNTPIWKMNCEGMSYPKLHWWQPVPGDLVCPDGVDFFDFSFFSERWAEDNCGASNDCDGRDLDQLGSVDIKDLRIFSDNWLKGF